MFYVAVYLRADERAERQVHVGFCLTVIIFKKWRSEGAAAGFLASCFLSTAPVSTSQEPA